MRNSRASWSWVSSGSGIAWVRSISSPAAAIAGPSARARATGSGLRVERPTSFMRRTPPGRPTIGHAGEGRLSIRSPGVRRRSPWPTSTAAAITFVPSNFPLTFFVIGLIVSLIAIAWSPAPRDAATIVEKLISWHVFFALGVTYFCNFVFHVFFGKMAAAFIGWADSPFQFEVGVASLGFSAVAFTRRVPQLRPAAGGDPGVVVVSSRRRSGTRLPDGD